MCGTRVPAIVPSDFRPGTEVVGRDNPSLETRRHGCAPVGEVGESGEFEEKADAEIDGAKRGHVRDCS
jgi:hypothetical protein